MTLDIAVVLGILVLAMVLFVTERVRVDVVAIMVMVSLAITGILTPEQAISGFSNPAVITVWAVFILSGGLSRTGVAGILGRQVLRVAGSSEMRLVSAEEAEALLPKGHWLVEAIRRAEAIRALLPPALLAYYGAEGFEL